MICLGFEDSSELTQLTGRHTVPVLASAVSPLENGEILWIKNRPEFNFALFSRLPPDIIWLIFWPARIEIVRVKNL